MAKAHQCDRRRHYGPGEFSYAIITITERNPTGSKQVSVGLCRPCHEIVLGIALDNLAN